MGISGRIAAAFQHSALTPLLAIMGLLLGIFAVLVTPKEEEPQIDVTFADVYIPFPGATPEEVESLVTTPAEQLISQIKGIDTLYSFSMPNGAMIIVMLLSLVITSLTGIAYYGIEDSAGPLAMLAGSSEWSKEMLEEVHEFFANLMVLLVVVHIVGVIVEGRLHRENLVKSMLNGRKRA